MDHRPLEGFVYAITPFNFTAIGGNLPTAPGADGQRGGLEALVHGGAQQLATSSELLREAGLPPGVINFVPGDAADGERRRCWPTRTWPASTSPARPRSFQRLWKTVGENIDALQAAIPRLVGETGGKDFIVAHASADPEALAVGDRAWRASSTRARSASAASRVYVPDIALARGARRGCRR